MSAIVSKLPLTNPGSVGVDPVAIYEFDNDLTDSSGNDYDLTVLQGSAVYTTVEGLTAVNVATGDIFYHNANPAALQIGLDELAAGDASLTFQCLVSYQSDIGYLFRLRDVGDTSNLIDNQLVGLRYQGTGNALSCEWEHGLGTDVTWDSTVPHRKTVLAHVVLTISSDGKTMCIYVNGRLKATTTVAQEAQKDSGGSNVQKFIAFGALECECAGMSLSAATFTADEVLAVYSQVTSTSTSVQTDLQTAIGPHRRVFAKIEGLEPVLFQAGDIAPPTTWSRSVKACLHPPTSKSDELNLKTMEPSISGVTIVLDDFDNDDGTSFLGTIFAPTRWTQGAFFRIAEGTAPHQQVDADETVIPIVDDKGETSASVDHELTMGEEALSTTSISGVEIDVVTRGLYPHVGTVSRGKTIPRPQAGEGKYQRALSQYAPSYTGREISLYVLTYNKVAGAWRPEEQALLFWTGRISGEITQITGGNQWRLGCRSITDELQREVGKNLASDTLSGINMYGDKGRDFIVREYNATWEITAYCEVTVTKGFFRKGFGNHIVYANTPAMQAMLNDINTIISDDSNWKNADGSQPVTDKSLYYTCGFDLGENEVYFEGAGNNSTRMFSVHSLEFCHALKAMGFDGRSREFTTIDQNKKGFSYWGRITSGDFYEDYMGCSLETNGGRLYCDSLDCDDFWDDQGDFGSAAGNLEISDAMISELDDKKENWCARYTAKNASGFGLGGYFTLDEDYKEFYQLTTNSYVGRRRDEDPISLKQVLIPRYKISSTIRRGPFEQLLPFLISSGTKDYNNQSGDSYDFFPLGNGLAIREELIDKDSFVNADKLLKGEYQGRDFHLIREAVPVMTLLTNECKLFGFALVFDYSIGKLAIVDILNPAVDEWEVSLDDSFRGKDDEWPEVVQSPDTVVNEYKISINRLPGGKPQFIHIISDEDSIDRNDASSTQVEIDHPGIFINPAVAADPAIFQEEFLRRPLAYPSPKLNISLAPVLFNQLTVGRTVKFVSSRLYNLLGTGERGIDVFATPLLVNWDLKNWIGKVGLQLHAQFEGYGDPYGPAALVDKTEGNGGWDVANKRLYLVDKTWGQGSDYNDGIAVAAAAGYLVQVVERAPANPAGAQLWENEIAVEYNSTDKYVVLTDAMVDWDDTKEYVLLFSTHDLVTTEQKTLATYQADVTTQQMDDGTKAQRYG